MKFDEKFPLQYLLCLTVKANLKCLGAQKKRVIFTQSNVNFETGFLKIKTFVLKN